MKRPVDVALKRNSIESKRMNIRDYFHTSPIRQSFKQAILDPDYKEESEIGKLIRLAEKLS